MTLTTNQEEKLVRALGVLVDSTPPGRDLEDLDVPRVRRSPTRRRGPLIAVAALLAVLALFMPLVLRSPAPPPGATATSRPIATTAPPPVSTSDTPAPRQAGLPPGTEGVNHVMREVPETGDLVALDGPQAFISDDGGETWEAILGAGDADLIGLAPNGAVVGVRNGRNYATGEFGPESTVWEAPIAMRYDPVSGMWDQSELPRPDPPVDAVPVDSAAGDCALGGFQWKWSAQSIASADQIVILGEHRVTAADTCDDAFHFAWTSPDGESWTVVDDIGIDGHPVGITWFADRYVAYGSADQWFAWLMRRDPQIWASTDLATWERADLDLSPLPQMGHVSAFPDNERSWGSPVVETDPSDGGLEVSFQIEIALPGPDAGISDVTELAAWLRTERDGYGYIDPEDPIETLARGLEQMGIDFPLDDEELDMLWHAYAATESGGRFVAETRDGLTWTTRYEE